MAVDDWTLVKCADMTWYLGPVESAHLTGVQTCISGDLGGNAIEVVYQRIHTLNPIL